MIAADHSEVNLHKHKIQTPHFRLFATQKTRYVRVTRMAYKHPPYFTRGANKPARIVTGKQGNVHKRFHAVEFINLN
jgi:hypothetical protein